MNQLPLDFESNLPSVPGAIGQVEPSGVRFHSCATGAVGVAKGAYASHTSRQHLSTSPAILREYSDCCCTRGCDLSPELGLLLAAAQHAQCSH